MSSQPVDHLHPVARLRPPAARTARRGRQGRRSGRCPPEQQRDALATLAQAEAQLDALKLRLLAEADRSDATTETGATRQPTGWR